MVDFIFAEHVRKDVFTFLVSLPDKEGNDHDLEVKIIFSDGTLDEVQPPFAIKDSDTGIREYWQMQGLIAQMVENATRQVETGTYDSAQAILEIEESGDVAPKPKVKKKKPEVHLSGNEKLNKEAVIKLRRKFRDRRHRELSLTAEGQRYGISGTSIANALLGRTWKHVTEEPPLTVSEYDVALEKIYPGARNMDDPAWRLGNEEA